MAFSTGDSLSRAGNLPEALPVLMEEVASDPADPWLLYRLAWTANRMERPDVALQAAMAAWTMEPSNEWFLAEFLRALRSLEMYDEALDCADLVRGGGVCRYYLADCDRRLGVHPSESMEYLLETAGSEDDSACADACIWLAVLHQDHSEGDSSILLAARAVELMPDEDFYRCFLAERLAESGDLQGAREQLHHLRLSGGTGYSYWQAMAALAEAEGDPHRKVWALRRAWTVRTCPGSGRDLGWSLYFIGRDALRAGETELARQWLVESSLMGDTSEAFVQRSDSLLELLDEFENQTADGV
jgi:tetratricopeptide (TPR) repeat protein